MVSIADVPMLSDIGLASKIIESVPFLGPAIINTLRLKGFLVIFHDSKTGTTYNLSLYTGATISQIDFSYKDGTQHCEIEITKGDLRLVMMMSREFGSGLPLPGPALIDNGMKLIVEETLNAKIHLIFYKAGNVVFDDMGSEGGMEVMNAFNLITK
jgi:hypothetical protein